MDSAETEYSMDKSSLQYYINLGEDFEKAGSKADYYDKELVSLKICHIKTLELIDAIHRQKHVDLEIIKEVQRAQCYFDSIIYRLTKERDEYKLRHANG